MYLKRKIWNLEREAKINKIDIGKTAFVAAKAQKKCDIPKLKAGKLIGVVTKLQERLDRLEDLRSDGSDRPPPLESGSHASWGPGSDLGRSRGRSEVPRNDHAPSTCGSAGRSHPMPPRHSGEEERGKWLLTPSDERQQPCQLPAQVQPHGHHSNAANDG